MGIDALDPRDPGTVCGGLGEEGANRALIRDQVAGAGWLFDLLGRASIHSEATLVGCRGDLMDPGQRIIRAPSVV